MLQRDLIIQPNQQQKLTAKIPLILYNGAFVIDNQSQEILVSNFFLKEEVDDLSFYFKQKTSILLSMLLEITMKNLVIYLIK